MLSLSGYFASVVFLRWLLLFGLRSPTKHTFYKYEDIILVQLPLMPRWTWARWRVNRWWMLDVLSWDVWGMITFSLGSAGCGTWTPWASSWNLQTVNLYKANLGIMFKQKQSALIEDCTRHGCFLAQSKTKTWIIRHIHTICFFSIEFI